jgi:hypothetical protein
MAASTATICDLCDLYPKFSTPLRPVREARYANASQVLSNACLLLHGCTCGKQKQRFPNYAHHHDCAESHDQSKLQGLRNKRIVHHRGQKLLGVIVGLNGGKEFEQILLDGQQRAMKLGRQQIAIFRQNLQSSQLGDLRQGLVRDDLL